MQHGYNIAPLCVPSRVAEGWLCTAGDSLRVMLCCVVWAVRHCMLVLMHLGFHICARCHAHMPLHLPCCAAFHSIPVLTALDSSAHSARLDRLAFDSLRKSERVSAPKLPAGAPAVRPDLDLHQSALHSLRTLTPSDPNNCWHTPVVCAKEPRGLSGTCVLLRAGSDCHVAWASPVGPAADVAQCAAGARVGVFSCGTLVWDGCGSSL